MRLLNRTAKNKYNKVNCSSLCHDMLIDTSWYRNFMSVNKNSWPHAGLQEECLHVDIVGSNLPCFGRPVFYLFGHSVRFSAVRFSIYSAVRIWPYGPVRSIVGRSQLKCSIKWYSFYNNICTILHLLNNNLIECTLTSFEWNLHNNCYRKTKKFPSKCYKIHLRVLIALKRLKEIAASVEPIKM